MKKIFNLILGLLISVVISTHLYSAKKQEPSFIDGKDYELESLMWGRMSRIHKIFN